MQNYTDDKGQQGLLPFVLNAGGRVANLHNHFSTFLNTSQTPKILSCFFFFFQKFAKVRRVIVSIHSNI